MLFFFPELKKTRAIKPRIGMYALGLQGSNEFELVVYRLKLFICCIQYIL